MSDRELPNAHIGNDGGVEGGRRRRGHWSGFPSDVGSVNAGGGDSCDFRVAPTARDDVRPTQEEEAGDDVQGEHAAESYEIHDGNDPQKYRMSTDSSGISAPYSDDEDRNVVEAWHHEEYRGEKERKEAKEREEADTRAEEAQAECDRATENLKKLRLEEETEIERVTRMEVQTNGVARQERLDKYFAGRQRESREV